MDTVKSEKRDYNYVVISGIGTKAPEIAYTYDFDTAMKEKENKMEKNLETKIYELVDEMDDVEDRSWGDTVFAENLSVGIAAFLVLSGMGLCAYLFRLGFH